MRDQNKLAFRITTQEELEKAMREIKANLRKLDAVPP